MLAAIKMRTTLLYLTFALTVLLHQPLFGQCRDTLYKTLNDTTYNVGDKILSPRLIFGGECFCQIMPETEDSLQLFVDFLKSNPQFKIEFGSHTDTRGSDKYNLYSSNNLAQGVTNWFIQTQDIDSMQVVPKGYGETEPLFTDTDIATYDTDEQKERKRQCNRRHVLTIIEIKKE